jgi:hypothetical protein
MVTSRHPMPDRRRVGFLTHTPRLRVPKPPLRPLSLWLLIELAQWYTSYCMCTYCTVLHLLWFFFAQHAAVSVCRTPLQCFKFSFLAGLDLNRSVMCTIIQDSPKFFLVMFWYSLPGPLKHQRSCFPQESCVYPRCFSVHQHMSLHSLFYHSYTFPKEALNLA